MTPPSRKTERGFARWKSSSTAVGTCCASAAPARNSTRTRTRWRRAAPRRSRATSSRSAGPAEVRHDLGGQKLDLTGFGVNGPEDEGVEAVVNETRERLDPPFRRSDEWFARQVSDRQIRAGRGGAFADQALDVDDPPDRARITARLL